MYKASRSLVDWSRSPSQISPVMGFSGGFRRLFAVTGVLVAVVSMQQAPALGVDSEAPAPTESSAPAPAPTESSAPAPAPTESSAPAPAPSPSYAPGMAPGEHAGWVAVGPDGRPMGGVMVCTPEVCGQTGSGSWLELVYGAGTNVRLVVQTLQDPVEASRAPNGIGNVAGYSGGTYNFETGKWTMPGSNGQILEIPLAYPGADLGGTVNTPVCIINCSPAPDTGGVVDPDSGGDSTQTDGETTSASAAKPSAIQSALPLIGQPIAGVRFEFSSQVQRERVAANTDVVNSLAAGRLDGSVAAASQLQEIAQNAAIDALPKIVQNVIRRQLNTDKIDSPLEGRVVRAANTVSIQDITASLGYQDSGQAVPEQVLETRSQVAQSLINPKVQEIFAVDPAKVSAALSRGNIYEAALAASPAKTNEIKLAQALSSGDIYAATRAINKTTKPLQTQVILSQALARGDIYGAAVAASPSSAATHRLLLAQALSRGDIASATRLMRR